MTDKISRTLPLGILTGIVVGAALGALLPGFMQAIDFIGRLFINALQVIVIPLILAAVISGVSAFGDLSKIGRTGYRIVLYFAGTSAIAVVIGLALALVIRPGSGVSAETLRAFGASGGYPIGHVTDMLAALIPFNLASGIVNGQYFGLILFSVLAGGILATMGAGARTVTTFFRQLNDVLMKLVRLVLLAAPLGVLSLVGSAVADNKISLPGLTEGFGLYALAIFIGLALQAFVILPLILARFAGRSPVEYIRNLSPALWTALGTGSSAATLPVTYRCAVGEGRLDNRAGALVLPLGAVANLNGTVISVVIATIFLSNVYGVALSAVDLILVAVTALLVSIGAAGVPMATPIVATIVLGVAGFTPVQIIAGTGLIVAVDWLVDRGRAVVNVWGDAVGAAVIAETFEFKTARRPSVRAADKKRESTRSPRPRGRSTGDRGRPAGDRSRAKPDSRPGRKPARSSTSPRGGRKPQPEAAKPAPKDRRGRSAPQREAPSESPFGITADSTPMLDVEGGSTPSRESDRPEPERERQPQKSRPRDESPKSSGGPRQQPADSEQGRDRRQQRETADSSRPNRRPAVREKKPSDRPSQQYSRPSQSRRQSRPQPPAEPEPQKQDRPQPEVDKDAASSRNESQPVSSNGRLSPATVARELAKVSAQLAGQNATPEKPDSDEKVTPEPAKKEDQVDRDEVSHKTEQTRPAARNEDRKTPEEASFPSSNLAVKVPGRSDGEKPPAEREKPRQPEADRPSEKTAGPAGAENTEENKPHFGRSRSRKGPRPTRGESPAPVRDEDKKKIPAGYSSEGASFGRGKKKKDR